MDGWITIGTELSTDKFDKQITDLEKKISKEERREVLVDTEISNIEEQIQEYKKLESTLELNKKNLEAILNMQQEMRKAHPEWATGSAGITQDYKLLNESASKLTTEIKEGQKALEKQGNSISNAEMKLQRLKVKQLEMNDQVNEYKAKIESVNYQKQQAELKKQQQEVQKLKDNVKGVGNAFQDAVSRAGRLALTIFGVRSAYNLLKSASSELATYDKQYATNLEYIRFVLAQAIAPVLRGIVQLAMQLLSYINAIVQGWFGINLFSSGSAENFKKMKKQAGGVSKAVKEIKKQLAGFDEANILTDQSDTGTSVGTPTMDLSAMQGKPPAWLQWIIDHKDVILSVLGGIAAALIAIKLGVGGIKSLGIGIMVTGIIMAVQGLIAYLKDPSWENFGKIIQGLGIAVIGFGIIIGGLPVIVIGAVLLIVGTILRYWEQIKGTLERGIGWLESKSDWVGQNFGGWIKGLYDTFTGWLRLVLRYFDDTFRAIKRIFDGFIQFFKGVFTGDWNQAWEGLKNIFGGALDWCKAKFRYFYDWVDRVILTPLKSLIDTVVNNIKDALHLGGNLKADFGSGISQAIKIPGFKVGGIVTIPKLAGGGLVNMPNRGTLLGSAIVGEGGPEGVIPLTDAQAMAELGEAIGKHVTINASIINKMNTRTISRELVRAQNEQNFAYNG